MIRNLQFDYLHVTFAFKCKNYWISKPGKVLAGVKEIQPDLDYFGYHDAKNGRLGSITIHKIG